MRLNIPLGCFKDWQIGTILLLCFSLIYIIFSSSDYNPDMVWQSCMAEGIYSVKFKADHLFYGAMVRGIFKIWQFIGLPGRAHVALQTINAIFGGISVMIMFLILSRILRSHIVSITGAIIFGFVPGVWHHATDVETYAASKMFMLICMYLIIVFMQSKNLKQKYKLICIIVFFHALGTFMNYIHVFLVPSILGGIFIADNDEKLLLSDRFKLAAAYILLIGIIVWGTYILIATKINNIRTLSDFSSWLTGPNYGWPALARMGWIKTPLKYFAEFSDWFIPFSLPREDAKRVIYDYISLSDYIRTNFIRIIAISILAILQVTLICTFIKNWPKIWLKWKKEITPFLILIVSYQTFHLYWGGWFMGFAIPAYFIFLAIAYELIRKNETTGLIPELLKKAIPIVCIGAILFSFTFSYLPEHNPENNTDLQEALYVAKRIGPQDLIVCVGGDRISEYYEYFAPEMNLIRIDYILKAADGNDRLKIGLGVLDTSIKAIFERGGTVYFDRIFSKEDDLTRPWNEFLFFNIKKEDVLKHLDKYKYKIAFKVDNNTYWKLIGMNH